MHVLRSLCFLRRLALAWFMASLLVAGASPLVNPQAMELVCSASGSVKLIVQGDDGSSGMGMAAMDCPLCVVSTPPPAATQVKLPTPLALGRGPPPPPRRHAGETAHAAAVGPRAAIDSRCPHRGSHGLAAAGARAARALLNSRFSST